MKNVFALTSCLLCMITSQAQVPIDSIRQTRYMAHNEFRTSNYISETLPDFDQTRNRLPQPIYDEDPGYIQMYWDTWRMAFGRFRQPAPGSPFISNYIDEAFNEALFLWDTAFMTMFCNYGFRYVPGIQSLDNFYFSQMDDGEIVREIDENTGLPRVQYAPPGSPGSLNHPILAWAELESFRITGDTARLRKVFYPLAAYFYAYNKIKDPISGLYYGSWASMDNSPRLDGMLCSIDTSSEMAMFARQLARIAGIIGLKDERKHFTKEADRLARLINEQLWNPETGFYYDLNLDHKIHNVKTIAGYWPLLAGIATNKQAEHLVAALQDTAQFKRTHMVPTVPADEPTFEPRGCYWRGGVWTPTDIMVIEGLEQYGYKTLADEIALNHLENVYRVYQKTGTVWEFYQPDYVEVGFQHNHQTRPDFTGWTACAPIKLFIEHKIGLHVDAPRNLIQWHISSDKQLGVEQLTFGNNIVNIVAEASTSDHTRSISVDCTHPFTLEVTYLGKTVRRRIPTGHTLITL